LTFGVKRRTIWAEGGTCERAAAMRSLTCLATLIAAVVLVPTALADTSVDVAITSVTASVSHARVGQTVTFTVTETNIGATVLGMDINGTSYSANLLPGEPDCGDPSSDGMFCEYSGQGPFVTGAFVTARYSFAVLPGARVATFTPCVSGVQGDETTGYAGDGNASNDCMTKTVRITGKT
jgi:hypothetical protein